MRIVIVSLMVLAMGLSACGRRGALENDPDQPKPKKADSFILDGLITPRNHTD